MCGDCSSDTGAACEIHGYATMLECLNSSDVRQPPRSASTEYQSHCGIRDESGKPLIVGLVISTDVMVRVDNPAAQPLAGSRRHHCVLRMQEDQFLARRISSGKYGSFYRSDIRVALRLPDDENQIC